MSEEEEAERIIVRLEPLRISPDFSMQLAHFFQTYTEQGKYDCVSQVLRRFPEFRASRYFLCFSFNSVLHNAAKAGHLGFIRFLIEELEVFYDGDPDRDNIFAIASIYEQLHVMKYLYEVLGIVSTSEKLLWTAIKQNRIDIVQYLHETVGIEPRQKEKVLVCAFKSMSVEMIEYCFYDLGVTTIKSVKPVEYAVYATMRTGDLRILRLLADLFTVTYQIRSIPPNRYLPKKHHFYQSFMTLASHNDLSVIQFCCEVLKVNLLTKDANSEWAHYLDLLQAAVTAGAAAVLIYLVQDLRMNLDLFFEVKGVKLSEIVDREWGEETTKSDVMRVVESFEEDEAEDAEPVAEFVDSPSKRPRLNSS